MCTHEKRGVEKGFRDGKFVWINRCHGCWDEHVLDPLSDDEISGLTDEDKKKMVAYDKWLHKS